MNISYPISVATSKAFLEELYQCEFGRYEDAVSARNNGEDLSENNYELVFCDFGGRYKTRIEMRNEQEVEETLYALRTGTIDQYYSTAKIIEKIQLLLEGKELPKKPVVTAAQKQDRDVFQKQVEKYANQCIKFLIANKMVRSHKRFKSEFKVQTKKIHRCWGGLSRTGAPRITISTRYIGKVGNFTEYNHVENSDFIGSFHSTKNDEHIKAVVAHEVAHAAVSWDWRRYNRGGKVQAHGVEWQETYKALRTYFKLISMPRPKHKKEI